MIGDKQKVAARYARRLALALKRHRILLLLASLLLGWMSVQLRHDRLDGHQDVDQSSVSPKVSNNAADFSILLPFTPDLSMEQSLKDITPEGSSSPLQDCRATSQVKLSAGLTHEKWSLQSLDKEGKPKTMGGDEFYITFRDKWDVTSEKHPSAVANILDRQDGTYELDFVAPPLVSLDPQNQGLSGGGGNLTIHFQYTCGIGHMAPPSKDDWVHGGALHKAFSISTPHSPIIRPFQPPSSKTSILSQYEQILVFGDSAMKQFVKNASRVFEPNIVFRVKRRKPWTMALIEEHLTMLRKQLGRDLDATATRPPHSTALVLGSSIWDILASNREHITTPQNPSYNPADSVFQDHLHACRHFINTARLQYPNVDVLWKSPTAMHIHVVDPSDPVNAAKNGDNGSQPSLLQRVRYMSSSRMAHLHRLQKQLMLELQVEFLDIYEATYLSAFWTFPGDGRHYLPELHQHMLRWFY